MRGTIARLSDEGGYGFIDGDNGQQFFFHRNALQATDYEDLAPGIAVEFEADRDPQGDRPDENPRAVNVRLADDAIPAVDHEVLPPEKTG